MSRLDQTASDLALREVAILVSCARWLSCAVQGDKDMVRNRTALIGGKMDSAQGSIRSLKP